MNKDALITFHDVSAGYEGRAVVNHISFEVDKNTLLALEGPNGSGKTTIVKVILGQLPAMYGHVIRRKGARVGYMQQIVTADLDFPISVRDVVLMGQSSGSRLFLSRAVRHKAQELIDLARLSDVADKPIGNISGGQRQRVMLCRALMADPDMLVLDEPVTYMDRRSEHALYDMLRRLRGRVGVVLVTHDAKAAEDIATQTIEVGRSVAVSPIASPLSDFSKP